MNFNKVVVVGNLTRDPERKNLPDGRAVVNFGLATNRFYNSQDGQKQQDTEFHNIVAFGRTAEVIAQYLKKGSMALIEGRLRTRNWTDNAGVKHYMTEIITERMQLGPRTGGQTSSNYSQQGQNHNPQWTKPAQPAQQNQNTPSKNQEEEIPVIQEEATLKTETEPDENQADKEANTPSPADDIDDEIDVKDIPF